MQSAGPALDKTVANPRASTVSEDLYQNSETTEFILPITILIRRGTSFIFYFNFVLRKTI